MTNMVLQVLLSCVFVDPQDFIQGQSLIDNLQIIEFDLFLCYKVQSNLSWFQFNTVPSVKFDMFKLSIRLVDPQV